eukprot:TRINITY_DN5249_c0_g1_i2.p1 TRINITY_DN5249_c0_g1~~TRINITY_DN5249_c0_g1_i2.p1  ORF type:complete len:767 (+),score=123.58 TRINITY_DN5249_c0_g1_i2:67-2301(+)
MDTGVAERSLSGGSAGATLSQSQRQHSRADATPCPPPPAAEQAVDTATTQATSARSPVHPVAPTAGAPNVVPTPAAPNASPGPTRAGTADSLSAYLPTVCVGADTAATFGDRAVTMAMGLETIPATLMQRQGAAPPRPPAPQPARTLPSGGDSSPANTPESPQSAGAVPAVDRRGSGPLAARTPSAASAPLRSPPSGGGVLPPALRSPPGASGSGVELLAVRTRSGHGRPTSRRPSAVAESDGGLGLRQHTALLGARRASDAHPAPPGSGLLPAPSVNASTQQQAPPMPPPPPPPPPQTSDPRRPSAGAPVSRLAEAIGTFQSLVAGEPSSPAPPPASAWEPGWMGRRGSGTPEGRNLVLDNGGLQVSTPPGVGAEALSWSGFMDREEDTPPQQPARGTPARPLDSAATDRSRLHAALSDQLASLTAAVNKLERCPVNYIGEPPEDRPESQATPEDIMANTGPPAGFLDATAEDLGTAVQLLVTQRRVQAQSRRQARARAQHPQQQPQGSAFALGQPPRGGTRERFAAAPRAGLGPLPESLRATESDMAYREYYGVLPLVARRAAPPPVSTPPPASPPPRAASAARSEGSPAVHGVRTIARARVQLCNSRVSPEQESSAVNQARLQRLQELCSPTLLRSGEALRAAARTSVARSTPGETAGASVVGRYTAGTLVVHPSHGEGEVKAVETDDQGQVKVIVHFDSVGSHGYLPASLHKLQIVEPSERRPRRGTESRPSVSAPVHQP